jgi:primosomal protein N'
MPCPIPRVNRMHRMQLVLVAPNPVVMGNFFRIFRANSLKTTVKMLFDIDPMF